CSFHFLMPHRQPSSTLFPYTTLFRSVQGRERIVRHLGPRGGDRTDERGFAGVRQPQQAHVGDDLELEFQQALFPGKSRAELPRGDRKSTRLNSSHVSISYAVFCLKKK